MKKINSRQIFTGVIIAVFCCSLLFFNPITTRSVNSLLTPTKSPMVSTESGSSNPIGDEWPMFHCSLNHTGVTETTPVGRSWKNQGPIWNYDTQNIVKSSPAVENGMVYVGSWWPDDRVYCLNATNGTQIWNYTTSGPVFSSPALVNGMVYVGSGDDYVYCLYANNGTLDWNYNTTGEVYSSPAVANGMVYVGSADDYVYCLYANNGTQDWSYDTGWTVESSPAVVNGMVYVGSDNNSVNCLYANNGTLDWSYNTGSQGGVASSPAVANGMVYVGSNDDCVYCLYANNGTQDWNYNTTGEVTSSPAVANGMVYVGSDNNSVYCFNASSGAVIWNYDTQWTVESSPAVANGMVYVGSDNNSVYCFNASSGAVIWNYDTGWAVESSPAVANGMVYVGDDYGNIYCLNATNGIQIWHYTSQNVISSSPAVANGMVYVGSGDGKVYCLPMIFCSVPSAPLNPAAISGNEQVSLSWNAPTDNGGSSVTGYNIYRSTSSGTETLLSTVGNVLTFTDTNVMPTTTYYYEVSAINPAGEGPNSTEINITTPTFTPTAPLNLNVIPGNDNITLTWQIPSDSAGLAITGYNIYRGTSTETEVLLKTVGSNTLTYTDTGLTAEQTYYYTVTANNSIGESFQSNEVYAAPFGVPSAPLNLNATPGNNNITLTWHAPSHNGGYAIYIYNIYRGNSSGAEVLLATVGANILNYTDMNLTANTTYYYQVRAINSAGIGPKSSEINATTLASSSQTKNKIGGMNIGSLLLVSFIGVIAVAISVKKRMK